MRVRKRRTRSGRALLLPFMIGEMTAASLETICHRTLLIAQGRCTPAEYRRMVLEKAAAAQSSAAALVRADGKVKPLALLSPWHSRVTANAKRLRKKKRT